MNQVIPPNYWEELRSQWVNGNRSDVYQALHHMKKNTLAQTIFQAVEAYKESIRGDTFGGDLEDLHEILRGYVCYTKLM